MLTFWGVHFRHGLLNILINLELDLNFYGKAMLVFTNFVKELSELNNEKNSNIDELKNSKMKNCILMALFLNLEIFGKNKIFDF